MRILAVLLLATTLWAQAPASRTEALADAAIAFATVEARKLGGEHRFKVVQLPRLPVLRPGDLRFDPTHLSKKEPLGRFFVVGNLRLDGEKVAVIRVDLEGTWVGKVLRAKVDLGRRAELTADQVEEAPFEGVLPEGALRELPQGMRTMRAVVAGKILTRGDLESVPLIESGDKVRLTATREGLTITVDTTARSRGGLGDRIKVEAPGAKRAVLATVTGPGEAKLL